MALRRLFGCLPVAAVLLFAPSGCKDKDDAAKKASAPDPDKRCLQLAKVCGEKEKHVTKIDEECRVATKARTDASCTEKMATLYDCYERELCGNGDKVWALGDLRVLAERHKKCTAEREATLACEKK